AGDLGRGWTLSASRAGITLPLGVLQSGDVQFEPLPLDTLATANRLAMGPVVRVTLVFRTAFWRNLSTTKVSNEVRSALNQLSFLFSPAECPRTWWTPMPHEAPMITAWVGGPAALA